MPQATVSNATRPAEIVVVENVMKRFGAFTALNDVTLKVDRGEKIVLCGPSAPVSLPSSGASTISRSTMQAGLSSMVSS